MAALVPSSTNLSADNHCSLKRLKHIMRHEAGVTVQWYDIGVELLDSNTVALDEIKEKHSSDVNKCCTEMFNKWLQHNPEANWDQLASVLSEVGLTTAAKNIKHVEQNSESDYVTLDDLVVDDEMNYIEKQLNTRTLAKLKRRFASVSVKICSIIEDKGLDIGKLILTLCFLDEDNITIFSTDKAFKKIRNTTKMFHHIGQYCSIYDYELLTAFVEATECQDAIKLLDDFTKELHSSVLSDIDLLCEDEELRDPKDFMPGTHKLVIKYDGGECTMKIEKLVRNIICECFHLKKGSVTLIGVKKGCVAFVYQISPAVKSHLHQYHITTKDVTVFFDNHIKCLLVDNEELKLSAQFQGVVLKDVVTTVPKKGSPSKRTTSKHDDRKEPTYCADGLLSNLSHIFTLCCRAVSRAARGNNSKEETTTSIHVDNTERIQEIKVVTTCDDHDMDEAIHHDDDASVIDVLTFIQSSWHTISTGSFIIERDPAAENTNNERNNPANDRAPEIESNPNFKPFESSAKCDDQVFELRSDQPEPFVEAEPVIMPINTTVVEVEHDMIPVSTIKEHQFSPAPAVKRIDS